MKLVLMLIVRWAVNNVDRIPAVLDAIAVKAAQLESAALNAAYASEVGSATHAKYACKAKALALWKDALIALRDGMRALIAEYGPILFKGQ